MNRRFTTPNIRCNGCNEEIFFSSYTEYARFRTDPSVTLCCPSFICSKKDNNVETCAVNHFMSSLPFNVKGTLLNSDGSKKTLSPEETEIREVLAREIKSRKESINNIQDVCDILNDTVQKREDEETGNDYAQRYNSHAKELATIIRSTYENNPTGISLDLIQAVLRQRAFIHRMMTTAKLLPTCEKDPTKFDFPGAIKDYHDFLLLIKNQPADSKGIYPTPMISSGICICCTLLIIMT
ncbi:hypothetical protein BJV82DRAFT_314486 [Fennellomyces sp. T-0311]|nr:hypothetical protein BJV82DRAFT_314486 [Fennellomyces sp. T-0311]